MTVRADEYLSSFMDGELGGERRPLLESLGSDGELRERWHRYHLIGETLRGGLPDRVELSLAERVRRQLASEPTVLAPRRRPSLRALQPYLKQAASLAIAAGVAVAAVLLVPQLMQNEPALAPAQQVAQATPPPSDAAMMRTSISPSSLQRRGVDQRLDDYLVNHYEHSAITRVQGVLPYVRIVGHSLSRDQ